MIVADANLIAYYLLPGPFTDAAEAARPRDGDWIAPRLWSDEFLNVLAMGVRDGAFDALTAMQAWEVANQIVNVPPTALEPAAILDLSVQSRVAIYDCMYVLLARKMGVRLVTNDKQVLSQFGDTAISIREFAAGH